MKFVVELNRDGYVMSYVNDYLSTSTMKCSSLDEALYEMTDLLKRLVKTKKEEMMDGMKELMQLYYDSKLSIDFFGIDLMNADEMRSNLAGRLKNIAQECLELI